LLNAKYLGVLSTAIKAHCGTSATDGGKVADFQGELNKLSVAASMAGTKSSLISLLSNFRSAINMPGVVNAYVSSKPYDEATSQRYRSQMSNFEKMDVIGRNPAILSGFRSGRECLTALEKLERAYNAYKDTKTAPEEGDIKGLATVCGHPNASYYQKLKDLKSQ